MKTQNIIPILAGLLLLTSCKSSGWNNFNKRKYLNLKHEKIENQTISDNIDSPEEMPESFELNETELQNETLENENTTGEVVKTENFEESIPFFEDPAPNESDTHSYSEEQHTYRPEPHQDPTIEQASDNEYDDRLFTKKIKTYETLLLISIILTWLLTLLGTLVIAGIYFPAYAAITSAFINSGIGAYLYIFLGGSIFFSIFFSIKARKWTRKAKKSYSTQLNVTSILAIIFSALGVIGILGSIVIIAMEFWF